MAQAQAALAPNFLLSLPWEVSPLPPVQQLPGEPPVLPGTGAPPVHPGALGRRPYALGLCCWAPAGPRMCVRRRRPRRAPAFHWTRLLYKVRALRAVQLRFHACGVILQRCHKPLLARLRRLDG